MIKYPAAERNKGPILDALKQILSNTQVMKALEIGSGTGQHVAHLAQFFRNILWQPSEFDDSLFTSISSFAHHYCLNNVLRPIKLDVSKDVTEWPIREAESLDMILCVNVIHITPWECSLGLFNAAGVLLKRQTGLLITYGPYAFDGVLVPESNVYFDQNLRLQNPLWGVRDFRDLKILAAQNGLTFMQMFDMPANNKILVFRKQ